MRSILALLLCSMLLAGCGGHSESHSILMAAPPSNSGALPPESADSQNDASSAPDPDVVDEAMALSTVATSLSGSYAGGENGCYTVATYEDGSADVMYFDYDARTMTMLQPGKQNEALEGHIPFGFGGITPMLYGGSLYLFHLGGGAAMVESHGDNGLAGIIKTGLDGTVELGAMLPSGWTFNLSSAVLSDEDFFYFLAKDEADGATVLARISHDLLGAPEELHRYEPGYDYSLEGYWEKGPLLIEASPLPAHNDPEFSTYWNNREFRLLAQGMNTGITTEVKAWQQGVATSTQDNTLYYWNPDDSSLYALNADTGEETLVAGGFAPSGYVQAQLMRNLLDGKLRVQFSTNSYVRDYYVDPATGDAVQTPVENLGDNVTVCAESPKGLLVRNGEHWVAAAKVPDFITGAAPSPSTPDWVSMPTYALIDADSYWAGRQRFTDIKDMVYD